MLAYIKVWNPYEPSLIDSRPCLCRLRFQVPTATLISSLLRRSDGTANLTASLPRVQPALALVCLLHGLVGFGEDQLDVARVRHVRVDLYTSADAV
jgi:hypothetical protein